VVDLLASLNTGHEGGCGTLHANSAVDVPIRLEALALSAGLSRAAAHAQIAAGLDLVLHVDRGTRQVTQIAVPVRTRAGLVRMRLALTWDGRDVQPGPAAERLARLVGERA
jgi:pilus assembly protein CpaF